MAPSTQADALLVGGEVFEAAARFLPNLPKRAVKGEAPASFAEAMAIVQARDDAKKRLQSTKDSKSKSKMSKYAKHKYSAPPDDGAFPGAVPGGEADRSAFWMVMDVSVD
jgi:hypothetical protein